MGVLGKRLGLRGHRAAGSHFLSAGGRSVIQQALAGLETPMPISAGDMASTDTMLHDKKEKKKGFSSSNFKTEHVSSVAPTQRHIL